MCTINTSLFASVARTNLLSQHETTSALELNFTTFTKSYERKVNTLTYDTLRGKILNTCDVRPSTTSIAAFLTSNKLPIDVLVSSTRTTSLGPLAPSTYQGEKRALNPTLGDTKTLPCVGIEDETVLGGSSITQGPPGNARRKPLADAKYWLVMVALELL